VRVAPWIVLTTLLAFVGARLGSRALGPELAVFVGALLVGAVSNVIARVRRAPSALTSVPGLVVLLPGSIGLRSLDSLWQRDVELGVQTAFTVGMIVCALVAGLLVANLVSPPRQEL
jgi:uncharacterized membrane protein YjjB (DUF3815 family)